MRFARTLLFGALLTLPALTPSWAQDESEPAAGDAQPPEQSDAQPPQQEQSDTAADEGAAGEAAQNFEQRFTEWKDLLKQLRETKLKYQAASREEREGLQQQWDSLIAKGNELMPQLIDAAQGAYRAAPNADLQLVRFLVSVAHDHLQHDRYEQALEVSRVLIDGKSEVSQIYDIAGIAAFSLHEFDAAKQYWDEAQKAGAMSDDSVKLAPHVDEYKEFWEEEQKLREAEANSDLPRVKLQTTKGDIEIELFEDQAPGTVGNFVSLVKEGFYDNVAFHRVLPGFMAQGGDPSGDGTGGPGYEIYDELGEDHRKHFRGSLSMANSGAPDSGGSQFFLTFRPTPHLNGKHTVFGRVISGFEVLEQIQRRNPQEPNPPTPDRIVKAEVTRQRDHEYVPNKVGEAQPGQ